jgi:hypothetical protein
VEASFHYCTRDGTAGGGESPCPGRKGGKRAPQKNTRPGRAASSQRVRNVSPPGFLPTPVVNARQAAVVRMLPPEVPSPDQMESGTDEYDTAGSAECQGPGGPCRSGSVARAAGRDEVASALAAVAPADGQQPGEHEDTCAAPERRHGVHGQAEVAARQSGTARLRWRPGAPAGRGVHKTVIHAACESQSGRGDSNP